MLESAIISAQYLDLIVGVLSFRLDSCLRDSGGTRKAESGGKSLIRACGGYVWRSYGKSRNSRRKHCLGQIEEVCGNRI